MSEPINNNEVGLLTSQWPSRGAAISEKERASDDNGELEMSSLKMEKAARVLRAAASVEDPKSITELTERDEWIDALDGSPPPLIEALESLYGTDEVIEALLAAGANPNQQGMNGATPALIAASRGRVGALRALTKAGADLSVENDYGQTPLTEAIQAFGDETFLFILETGVDVNQAGKEGVTALMAAAANGRFLLLSALIKAGARVNATQASDGWTALHWAACAGELDCAQALLAAGADPEVKNHAGSAMLGALTQMEDWGLNESRRQFHAWAVGVVKSRVEQRELAEATRDASKGVVHELQSSKRARP